ncbi:MAG: ABC transporter substrate-binding protein, partial [Clostridia bacterium]|nr:ABC transporter substrate-binding protein [Clostridia bacterium]
MRKSTGLGALFAAVSLLLCLLGGCTPESPAESEVSLPAVSAEESAPVKDATLSLSYNADDTLDPFATVSRANLELASLLYEGLTRMNDKLTAQPALAASLQAEGTTVTAVLRKNARFSDGSAVTAGDVVKSFQLAKKSPNYQVLLQNVRSASADKKGTTVTFTLGSVDVGYAACLSFPVIKASTATDKKGQAPIGSGVYCFSDANTLTVNPHAGKTPGVTKVDLISVSDSNALVHALEHGTLGYLFSDLSGGSVPYTTAANTAVDIHYLIFMGVNANRKALSNAKVRQALSLAVDRELLALEGLNGYARAASSPFHPLRADMSTEGLPLLKATDNTTAAKKLLSA